MNKVDELVNELKLKRSEDILGMGYPPKHQCSNIDSIIRNVNSAKKALYEAMRYDEKGDIVGYVDDANHELYSTEEELEGLRDAIIELREWGQQWKDLCKQFLNDREDLNEYLEINFNIR